MFRAFAALALASAAALPTTTLASAPAHPAATPAALNSSSPWWERVTVTMSDDGQAKSCRYETSLIPDGAHDCSVVGDAAMAKTSSASTAKNEVTRITFERRFSPDASPQLTALGEGEVLLGGRTLALSIDGAGAVKGCHVISTSGSLAPQYGCTEAAAEHFTPTGSAAHSRTAERTGFLSVLVYGHSEHVV